jgi:hypothetical protein
LEVEVVGLKAVVLLVEKEDDGGVEDGDFVK